MFKKKNLQFYILSFSEMVSYASFKINFVKEIFIFMYKHLSNDVVGQLGQSIDNNHNLMAKPSLIILFYINQINYIDLG